MDPQRRQPADRRLHRPDTSGTAARPVRGVSCHLADKLKPATLDDHMGNAGPSCHTQGTLTRRTTSRLKPANLDNHLGTSGPSCHKQGTHGQTDPGPTTTPPGHKRPEGTRGAGRAPSTVTEAFTVPRQIKRPTCMRHVFRTAPPAEGITRSASLVPTGQRRGIPGSTCAQGVQVLT